MQVKLYPDIYVGPKDIYIERERERESEREREREISKVGKVQV